MHSWENLSPPDERPEVKQTLRRLRTSDRITPSEWMLLNRVIDTLDTLEVLLAHEAGELSEGQAAHFFGRDRVALRRVRQTALQAVTKRLYRDRTAWREDRVAEVRQRLMEPPPQHDKYALSAWQAGFRYDVPVLLEEIDALRSRLNREALGIAGQEGATE